MNITGFVDSLGRDLRHALRRLPRRPAFTLAAVTTLALAIGATTAIFSVVYSVLIKPLPFPSAEELVRIRHAAPGLGVDDLGQSPTMVFTYRDENRTLAEIGFMTEIRSAVWSVNAGVPIALDRTMQNLYSGSLARTSFSLVMLAIAGAMALALGIVGIYGVIAYVVSQRSREIGIRLALGARQHHVRRMFLRHGLALAGAGMAIGLAAALGVTQLMSSLLFGVAATDPAAYFAALGAILGAAALASYLPARRAAAIDPVDTLKAE